jgi:hypothetical protein
MFFGTTRGMARFEKASHRGNLEASFLGVSDGKCVEPGVGFIIAFQSKLLGKSLDSRTDPARDPPGGSV